MKSTEQLVREFAVNVIGQKNALKRNDARAGNRCALRYERAWHDIRDYGDEGREALSDLLLDERADVRAMAAACLLRYKTAESLRVLREIAAGEGLAAFGASQTLERWEETLDKNKWGLDPIE